MKPTRKYSRPTAGGMRSSDGTNDIACWFVDTDHDGQSFFVRHAYVCDGQKPYDRPKTALRAEVDAAVSALNTRRSYAAPFAGRWRVSSDTATSVR